MKVGLLQLGSVACHSTEIYEATFTPANLEKYIRKLSPFSQPVIWIAVTLNIPLASDPLFRTSSAAFAQEKQLR